MASLLQLPLASVGELPCGHYSCGVHDTLFGPLRASNGQTQVHEPLRACQETSRNGRHSSTTVIFPLHTFEHPRRVMLSRMRTPSRLCRSRSQLDGQLLRKLCLPMRYCIPRLFSLPQELSCMHLFTKSLRALFSYYAPPGMAMRTSTAIREAYSLIKIALTSRSTRTIARPR